MKLKRTNLKRALFALMAIFTLLMPAIAPASLAHAEGPTFALSANSGWPGLRIEISQVAPCPAIPSGWDYQTVNFTFTDANGTETPSTYFANTDSSGTWSDGTIMVIPWRDIRIVGGSPTVVGNAAAVGNATIEAQCIIGQSSGDEMDPNDDATQVAQTYDPQTFNVNRDSLEFAQSVNSIAPGDTVTLNSIDPCPGSEVHGSIINDQAVSNFTVQTDENGHWSADVLAASTDSMSGEITNFPVGSYEINAFCQTTSGLATTFYGESSIAVADTPVAQPNYVAMGDSYSSGEGVEPFEDGTYGTGSNMCHRSTQAYARLLANDSSLNLDLGSNGFAACSGAKTNAVTVSYNGEAPQLSKITANTKIITMTLGGNDMEFADYAKQCILHDCSGADSAAAVRRIVTNVIPNMNSTLTQINNRLDELDNSDATVLVVGYPQLLPTSTFNTVIAGCSWLNGGRELRAIRNVTTLLNTAIKNETVAAGSNFRFVSATETDSPFAGHEICKTGNTWYFYNVVALPLDKQIYTFHPNAQGQQAYATLIKDYIVEHNLGS